VEWIKLAQEMAKLRISVNLIRDLWVLFKAAVSWLGE
jgi:hypothetical protein